MITLTVTSDSSLPELHIARRSIIEMIELHNDISNVPERINQLKKEIAKDLREDVISPTFNATELAEAETLGKPVCSTVDAEASKIAPEDTQVNTSIPTPQSVFAQPVQTTENAANPVAPATETPVLDADGLVWDQRIHSSSRELNKDGTWRKRRGVNTDLVTKVETELRGMPIGTVTDISDTSVTVKVDTRMGNALISNIPNDLSIGYQLPANPLPPVDHSHEGETPVFTATIPTDMTFPELLDGVTKAMVAGQLTQARINEALNSIGVQALPHLIARTDLIPAFRNALGGVV